MVPSTAAGPAAPNVMRHCPRPAELSSQRPARLTGGGAGACDALEPGPSKPPNRSPLQAVSASKAKLSAQPWIAGRTTFMVASFHRRYDEFGAFLGAGRPARRHRLGLGVEPDRIRTVLVEIAEAGALPAAERVVR